MPDPLTIHLTTPIRPKGESDSIRTKIESQQLGKKRGRVYSHPPAVNGQISRIAQVEEAKLRGQKGFHENTAPPALGGLMRKMYEELKCKEGEARSYPEIGTGDKTLKPYEVKRHFLSFLQETTLEAMIAMTEEWGKEEVARAADKAAFVQLAAEKGHVALVKFLVEELGCDPNTPFDSLSPLLSAARGHHLEIVEFLLPRSAPASFYDTQRSKAGIIAYSAAGSNPSGPLLRMLVDRREEFPILLSGSRPAAFHLVSQNRKTVSRWLEKKMKFPIGKRESDASLLAKVVEAANTRQMRALHSAVRQDDPLLVDLLVAAGACPDALDKKGRAPMEFAKNPLIVNRLKEAQEMQDSFRERQLEHLLKDQKSSRMTSEDQTLSWSNLIRTLETTPGAQQEFAELAKGMRKSLALSFVIENPLVPQEEKRQYVQGLMTALTAGEWVMMNDHSTHGHHKVNFVEKQRDGSWLCLQGDRYKNGSRQSQISDTRRITPLVDRAVSFCLEETVIYKWPDRGEFLPGKIKKKWQGAEDNCVTQSDTVAFDYVLGETLGKPKAALYRQLKPLRLHYLSSCLKRQGKPDFSKEILHWLESPAHARFSDLCPLILPKDTYKGKHPSELLNDLDRFITAEDGGQLYLWQRGSDGPVQTADWQEWQSLSLGVPREACDAGRRLRLQNIKDLAGEGSHIEFTVNKKHEGKLVCDLFTPPVALHFQITETGILAFQDPEGVHSFQMNTLASLWKKLPELFEREAKATASTPHPQILKNWLNDVLLSAYKRSYRNAYGNQKGTRPPIGGSWRENGALIEDFLQGKWTRGNTHTVIGLLGTAALSLTESLPYRERLKEITGRAIDEICGWASPVKIGKKHAIRKKHREIDSVALELPPNWQERLQNCFDDAWTRFLSSF